MNIFLLSSVSDLQTDLRNTVKLKIAERGNNIAYISSEPQGGDRPYYQSTVEDYSKISRDIILEYFDLSENFLDKDLLKILNYGTVYLSGGNTYMFMASARKRNIYPILKKHLENGRLLIGASAGSIIMTPSISLAGFEDENIPNLKDTAGFNFVDFEFHPHYRIEDKDYLKEYMSGINNDLYVCKDGDGIFYSNGAIKLFGKASRWENSDPPGIRVQKR